MNRIAGSSQVARSAIRLLAVAATLALAAPRAEANDPVADAGQTETARTGAASLLAPLLAQFANLDEVAFVAEVRFVAHGAVEGLPPAGAELAGELRFAADGARWRSRSVIDGFRGMNTETAFDGEQFYFMQHETGVLGMSASGDHRQGAGVTVYNPILGLATAFAPDRIDRLHPTLAEAAEHAAAFDGVEVVAFEAAVADGDEFAPRRITLHRQMTDAEGFDHGLLTTVVTMEPDGVIPSRIDHLDAEGTLVSSIEFLEPRTYAHSAGQMVWPTVARLSGFHPGEAAPVIEMTITIRDLRIGPGAADGVEFALDPADARSVWIEEAGAFVR